MNETDRNSRIMERALQVATSQSSSKPSPQAAARYRTAAKLGLHLRLLADARHSAGFTSPSLADTLGD